MATTTPNFGWPVPTSTDLVKDGAVAIEALGDAVDASLLDLKGGTTGQVLAKTSNTDMDFTWVTENDADAIQNSIVNAKGDLIAASANDVPAILTVGANGTTLVADSSTATGLRYQGSTAAGRNFVVGGGFDIWQRGTSFAAITAFTNSYTADRWGVNSAAASGVYTVSRQSAGLTGFNYSLRMQRTAGSSVTNNIQLFTGIETVNSIPLQNQTVTLSFYAKAGANYSGTSNGFTGTLLGGTGTDQNPLGMTGQTSIVGSTVTLTTSWQRFSITGTVGSTITELVPYFTTSATGTAGANDWVEVTGIQLEVGSVATNFTRAGGTIQGELAACQRYYWRIAPYIGTGGYAGSNYARFGLGAVASATGVGAVIPFPVPMRFAPTSLEGSGTANHYAVITAAGTPIACSAVPAYDSTTQYQAAISFTVASGLTTGQGCTISVNNGAAAYLGFSGEL